MKKLDEAIERFSHNAEYERTHGNLQGFLEFKQLAKWLKELRAYRKTYHKEHVDDFLRAESKELPKGHGKALNFSERVSLEQAYYKHLSETAKETKKDFVLADNALQVITYLSKEGYLNDAKIRHDIGGKV